MHRPVRKITFIGLGVMGAPMAGHLANAGYQLSIYNRSPDKVTRWLERYAGQSAEPLDRSVAEADLVITCVGNDDDLKQLLLGDTGILSLMPAGASLVDHTTASAGIAQLINQEATGRQIHFLDAPVSGGEAGAVNGQLTIMCGGDQSSFEHLRPVLEHYAVAMTLMGPSGSGQLTKMVNQITISGLIQGLAEGIHFAESAGLDCNRLIEVISRGAAQSWQMDNRAGTMINGDYDFGFAVDLMRKDLGICLDQARKLGARLPVTALVDQFYGDVQAMGGNRWDTSSLLERLRLFESAADRGKPE